MTSRATQAIFIASPSIPKILRYLEWVSLAIPALRMLFPVLYEPLGYEVNRGDFLAFGVLGLLAILSVYFPLDRPLWQRRLYIGIEVGLLLATRLYSDWGFDLLLWLVLAKSWFLLSRRGAILTTILAGVAWQWAIAHYFMNRLSQADALQAELEALQAVPLSLQIVDIVINSTTIFVAANALIIVLCLTVIAERKSRQREAALAQEVEILAADLERNRIARDIHDSLGHTLTSLDVQIELAQRLYERGSDQVRQALDTSKRLANQSLQDLRHAVTTMRHESFDLSHALTQLLASFQQDMPITIKSHLDLPPLPLHTSHQLYCMIKEALENTRRHSQAKTVHLMGKAVNDCVIFSLEDDGVGFSPEQPTSGFGLQGMRERCQLIGGQIIIDSAPGRGTAIQITVSQ